MSNQQIAVEHLAKYLKAAARQRYLMEPRLQDKQFVAAGGKLFHAVDTDVVKLHTDPSHVAVASSSGREGYAQFFPDDDKLVSIALGRALADFIFHKLNANATPLMVVPPMEQELRDVYRAVRGDAETEQLQSIAEFDKLRRLADRLKREAGGAQTLPLMLEHAPTLARLLGGTRGHVAEYMRYLRLLRDKCILPLDSAIELPSIATDEVLRAALAPAASLAEIVSIRDLREDWIKRLKKEKNAGISSVRLYDDAQVLARIEWINARLDDRHRVVLISGDHAMHQAASAYTPDGATANFATLYLRHPKCYLSEKWVLSPERDYDDSSIETEFYRWLETFLANIQLDGRDRHGALRQLADRSVSEIAQQLNGELVNPTDLVTEFRMNWANYTNSIMLAHGRMPSDEYETTTNDNEAAKKLWSDITNSLMAIETQLDERVLETWDAFFESAAATGYVFLRQGKQKNERSYARRGPLLVFDRFSQTNAFSQKIQTSYNPKHLDEFYQDLVKLKFGSDGDTSGYTFSLAFGMLFGAEGAWSAAAILAQRALHIAERQEGDTITGREAAYLLAVSRRHAASNVADLEEVSKLLDRAEECLAKDIVNYPPLCVGNSRFQAERIALALTYHLFHRFQNELLPDYVISLDQIRMAALEALSDLGKERDATVRNNIERHLITNLLMAALLENGVPDTKLLVSLKPQLGRLKLNIANQGDVAKRPANKPELASSLVSSVVSVTECLIEQNFQRRKNLQRKTLEILDAAAEFASVMPYDSARFRYMRQLVTAGT